MKNTDVRHLKKVSSACSYCKQRKRKCSAQLPCDNCVSSDRECVYGEGIDGRRRESIQRVRTEFVFHKNLLHSLIDKLRHGHLEDIRAMVKDNTALEDLAARLTSLPTPSESQTTAATQRPKPQVKSEDLSKEWFRGRSESLQTLSSGCRESNPPAGDEGTPGNLQRLDTLDVANPQTSSHTIQPANFSATHPSLSTLFSHFRDARRQAIAAGTPKDTVLGSQQVDLDPALRTDWLDGSCFTPSAWVCQVQRKFESIDIYVRLICIYFIQQYLRWAILPTEENYDLLPVCMRPTLTQRLIPHHAAIDICHLPALRDILVHRDRAGPSSNDNDREDIVAFQLAGVRTNWEGSWNEAVCFDHQLGFHTLTPQFIETASKVDRWIAGRILLDTFPSLDGMMYFANEDVIAIDSRQLHEVLL